MTSSNQDTLQKVIAIIADTLTVDKSTINADSTFEALGADSLDQLEIIMKFEEQFGIEIDDEKAAEITTVGQAAQAIEQLKQSN